MIKENKKVKCPECGKMFVFHKENYRPFCSSRCQEIDLGHWLNEDYSVPAVEVTTEELEALESELDKRNRD